MQADFLWFDINRERGFLKKNNNLSELPDLSDFNQALNKLVSTLPSLIQHSLLSKEIEQLEDSFLKESIAIDKDDIEQNNIAILVLEMLTQAYIWENPENPRNQIPTIIAQNLYGLCRAQQRFPILTYADYILNNWKLINPLGDISLDNIEPLFTFTDTVDEAWFIKIHIMVEAVCAEALTAAYQLCVLTHEPKITDIAETQMYNSLNVIADCLQKGSIILEKMLDACDPAVYWHQIRIFLNGWEKVKVNDKVGVILNGISTADKVSVFQFKGPSGAQSGILPALDAVLGVKHDIDGMYQMLLTFQQYMPGSHQLFINFLKQSKIEAKVSSISVELHNAWKNAVDHLQQFRKTHLQLIKHYIYQPAESLGMRSESMTGTGGAPIDNYLKNRYENTVTE